MSCKDKDKIRLSKTGNNSVGFGCVSHNSALLGVIRRSGMRYWPGLHILTYIYIYIYIYVYIYITASHKSIVIIESEKYVLDCVVITQAGLYPNSNAAVFLSGL